MGWLLVERILEKIKRGGKMDDREVEDRMLLGEIKEEE